MNWLSILLRSTKGLFGSKSATGGSTTINEHGRTITQEQRHDETINDRILRFKKKK